MNEIRKSSLQPHKLCVVRKVEAILLEKWMLSMREEEVLSLCSSMIEEQREITHQEWRLIKKYYMT